MHKKTPLEIERGFLFKQNYELDFRILISVLN